MTISNTPNWKKVMNNANEILVKSKVITTFPFSPKKVVKELSSIKCCTYARAEEKYHVNIKAFGSESAVIMRENEQDQEILFYNNQKPKTHIRFSILHELGHVVNGHSFAFESEERAKVKEIETNFFAAQLLMPEQLIREFQRRGVTISKEFLMKTFVVSKEAAEKRLTTLRKINWNRRSFEEKQFDEGIVLKYSEFLDSIKPSTVNNIDWFEDEYDLEIQRSAW